MSCISLKNIRKVYPGNVTAVHNFSLEILDKEFLILVGPSGCGKSTTLRMIAGLEDITDGGLYIGNKLINNVAPKDRDIAMVFQNYALYPHMTVYKNMSFSLQLRKVPKAEINQKVLEAAKILDIEHLLNRKPLALSGGQRQRVALGRAIVREPAVFLLDEPLSNLDAKLRTQMRSEIIKLHKRLGTTFIYVTHDQTEAMTMGDRIVVMKDGFIQQVDTPQNLYDKPCNTFVASFIGSPQMNMLEVVIEKFGEYYVASFGGSKVYIPVSKDEYTKMDCYVGKAVVLGIRPEGLFYEDTYLKEGYFINCTVDLIEPLGAEAYLYVISGEKRLVARIQSQCSVMSGKRLNLRVDVNKLYLFDKDSGLAILY